MGRVRQKGTAPELKVRRFLFARGLRYRLNVRSLPGSPDIVLRRLNTVIFVHGCFWHRHLDCHRASTPKTRHDFWQAKFIANVARDARNVAALQRQGWKVIIVWECEIADELVLEAALRDLLRTS
jgi:DNA mismatch endonuclease (patch repair protein)